MQSSRASDEDGEPVRVRVDPPDSDADGAPLPTDDAELAGLAHKVGPPGPEGPVPPDPDREPEAGPDELAVLQEQFAQLEDRYRRSLADLDNYRKRAGREVERRIAEAREGVIRDWLDVVDSVERALAMTPEGPLREGLRAVLDQMEQVLAREGVTRMGRPGEPFDPERHEAVGVVETTDAPDRTILEVARSGYALGDRILRPAQVVVARAPSGDG
jgi:molecular chaperone GrpE